MGLPSRWRDLARLPRPRLVKLAERRLERALREELLTLHRGHRLAAEGAGLDPLCPLAGQLSGLPLQTLESSERWGPLVPAPQAIRAAWPLSRKLGLMLLGERGRRALARAYAPREEIVEVAAGRRVAIQTTERDAELEAELIARWLDVFELEGKPLALALPGERRLSDCLRSGARQVNSPVSSEDAPDFESEGLIATLEGLEDWVRRGVRHERARVVALLRAGGRQARARARALLVELGAESAQLASLLHLPVARVTFASAPAADEDTPEYTLPVDLVWLEGGDPPAPWTSQPSGGSLLLTHLEHHGTALLRFDTGLPLERFHLGPCPRSGRTLPRFSLRE